MKLIYKGKYSGDPETIPHGQHKENAVKFKEYDDLAKFGIVMNLAAVVFMVMLAVVFGLRAGGISKISTIGCIVPLLLLFPHELLHAVCFKDEVYLYTNLKSGMLFVIGLEAMSRLRYVFMCFLPNIVFGFVPFSAFLINPDLTVLGTIGFVSIPTGLGDYYNAFNALMQSPKSSRIYMYKTSTYWYMP